MRMDSNIERNLRNKFRRGTRKNNSVVWTVRFCRFAKGSVYIAYEFRTVERQTRRDVRGYATYECAAVYEHAA